MSARISLSPSWATGLLSILGPLGLYVVTLPRTVVLEDDGLFLMAAQHLGVAHPPGYPLFTWISWAFLHLPVGTEAFRGHLASAVLGALACGVLYLLARQRGVSPGSALAGAWALGASEHFWSQAIIAEVYTLNALLLFMTYGLVGQAVEAPKRWRGWVAAAATYGLGLANHYPLMVLAFPGLVLLAWPRWREVLPKVPGLLGVTLLTGGLPYAWMVWRSQQNPAISFYGPIEGWQSFWFYFSRQGYAGVDVSPSAGWWDRWEFLQWFGNELFWQLTPLGFLLALWGALLWLRERPVTGVLSGLLIGVSNSVVLLALLAFDYDYLNIAVFRPYSLVCYGFLALWLTRGLDALLEANLSRTALRPWAAAVVGVTLAAGLVGTAWSRNQRADDHFAEAHAELLSSLLPEQAVLIVFGDAETGPLGYYRFVEQRRPDVTLVSAQGLVYANRLFPARSSKRRKQEVLRRFIETTDRPVFYTVDAEQFPHGQGVRHLGFLKEVVRSGTADAIELSFRPEAEAYFQELLRLHPEDRWERFRRNKLLYLYGDFLGYALLGGGKAQATAAPLVQQAQENFYSLTGMVEVLLQHGRQRFLPEVRAFLTQADGLRDETLDKERSARFHYLLGFTSFLEGKTEAAIAEFETAYRIYPHPENSAITALKQLNRPLPEP